MTTYYLDSAGELQALSVFDELDFTASGLLPETYRAHRAEQGEEPVPQLTGWAEREEVNYMDLRDDAYVLWNGDVAEWMPTNVIPLANETGSVTDERIARDIVTKTGEPFALHGEDARITIYLPDDYAFEAGHPQRRTKAL